MQTPPLRHCQTVRCPKSCILGGYRSVHCMPPNALPPCLTQAVGLSMSLPHKLKTKGKRGAGTWGCKLAWINWLKSCPKSSHVTKLISLRGWRGHCVDVQNLVLTSRQPTQPLKTDGPSSVTLSSPIPLRISVSNIVSREVTLDHRVSYQW